MRTSIRTALYGLAGLASAALIAQEGGVFSVLKSNAALGKQAAGYYLVPTNQLLRPWGEQNVIPGRPVDMAFDSDKRLLAVLNWRSILLLDGSTGTTVAEIPSKSTSYTGIAYRPGNRELWASEATRNGPDSLLIAQLSEVGMPGERTHLEFKDHPVPAGIAFSPDGKLAYVAFSRNNSLAVIDASSHEIVKELPVGVAPFGVAVSKSRNLIFVANRGGRRASASDTVAHSSGSLVVSDPATGAATTGTLSIVDGKTLAVREIAVGLGPSVLALSPDETIVAVANG